MRSARANKLFKAFVERVKTPVVHSLMAVDARPYGHPSRVGLSLLEIAGQTWRLDVLISYWYRVVLMFDKPG
jgi:thiamine pyrophosphate-dependent acetolactate synthase large subunit-like protein